MSGLPQVAPTYSVNNAPDVALRPAQMTPTVCIRPDPLLERRKGITAIQIIGGRSENMDVAALRLGEMSLKAVCLEGYEFE